MAALRVLLVQEDRQYRLDLEALLRNTPGLTLAGSFEKPLAVREWMEQAGEPCFDVALIDIQPPHVSGIELTRELRDLAPGTALVMLTVDENPQTIREAICAGADGYLLKRSSAHEIIAQVRTAATGGVPMTASVARSVLEMIRRSDTHEATGTAPAHLALTPREQEVLRAFVRGLSYQEVAGELDVSIDTVRSHVRALYKKLQVHSLAAAVARAIRDRLV